MKKEDACQGTGEKKTMKNYKEVMSAGRGAGTDKSYTVAFEPSFKLTNVSETIVVFDGKAGLAIKYLPTGGKPLSGFIKKSKLRKVVRAVNKAVDLEFEAELHPAAISEPPYIFKMGNGFKGKTPGQCLLEGMSEEQLLNQRNWMANNCTGKFAEANRKGVEAIDKALEQFRNGTLTEQGQNTGVLTIFKSGPSYLPKKLPQPYQTEGWEMDIIFNVNDRNPWSITWTSKTVTVQDNVITASQNPVYASVNLTDEEFLDGFDEAMELFADIRQMYRPARIAYYAEHKDDWKFNKEGYN
jgi:hypothetical protein